MYNSVFSYFAYSGNTAYIVHTFKFATLIKCFTCVGDDSLDLILNEANL